MPPTSGVWHSLHRRPSEFSVAVFKLLRDNVSAGDTIVTLASGALNTIVDVTPEGVTVDTQRTKVSGNGPQIVPAWMIEVAWRRLQERRRLTNKELLSTEDLNVKRSSFICALLAQLPEVEVASTRPIVLELRD